MEGVQGEVEGVWEGTEDASVDSTVRYKQGLLL